mgnify:CR=1 FL=1|tara:strand:+ start:14125 stop:14517 length:393 start_codon:yes stop_codon:yes gene_type:complete
MATLSTSLTLSSTDATSDSLNFTVTDALTVVSPIVNISKITATVTGGDTIIVPNLDSPRYVYLKHTGLNSAGSSSGSDKVHVETADGTTIMELKATEFAFFPFYAEGAGKLQLEASANTVQVEYAYFTRG